MRVDKKREQEKKIVGLMIDVYAKKHPVDKEDLIQYVNTRIDRCPFMENKTFCSMCKVHCYRGEYRDQIREVMRYSGPRMLWYHPLLAIKHMYYTIKAKTSR